MTLQIPSRRGFLAGLSALIAAPAIVRADNIMRVKPVPLVAPPVVTIYGGQLEAAPGAPSLIASWFQKNADGSGWTQHVREMVAAPGANPMDVFEQAFRAVNGPHYTNVFKDFTNTGAPVLRYEAHDLGPGLRGRLQPRPTPYIETQRTNLLTRSGVG